jgi:hypothetical protein
MQTLDQATGGSTAMLRHKRAIVFAAQDPSALRSQESSAGKAQRSSWPLAQGLGRRHLRRRSIRRVEKPMRLR